MKQLIRDEAIALFESGAWKQWSAPQRAAFQMVQDFLCMPFGEFHKAVEEALGRPVYTHEFGLNRDGLMKEMAGIASAPSVAEILALLPSEKTIVLEIHHDQRR
jgi:hypothetical protein